MTENNVVSEAKRIVVKIGTATLTHETGRLNLRRMEELVRVLSDLKNAGKRVVLVSSGAVSAGAARLNYAHHPKYTEEKQAMAAVGQSELMRIYERFFASYGHTVAQILLTRDVVESEMRLANAESTFALLISMGCVPIVNENDSISSDEIKFSGNDILSAYVAQICHAELLINLSDFDGLFEEDPRKNPDARLIPYVDDIDAIAHAAGGAGTERGTGGMAAKLRAAKIAAESGIPMIIMSGRDPARLYGLLEGKMPGTFFTGSGVNKQNNAI